MNPHQDFLNVFAVCEETFTLKYLKITRKLTRNCSLIFSLVFLAVTLAPVGESFRMPMLEGSILQMVV